MYSKSGWNFAVDEEGEPAVNVTINGQPVEVLKVHGEKPSKQIWAGYAIFKTPGNPADPADITSVSIADVAVPRAGDVAETTFSTTTEDITVDGSIIAAQFPDHSAPGHIGVQIRGEDDDGNLKMIAGFNNGEFLTAW